MNIELLKTLTILYVEDEQSLQEEVFQNLSPFIKKIFRANDGLDGLSIFKENEDEIDLVISDIMMPHMNGIDMVENIRELNSNIPIIYATAFNDNEYLLKTLQQNVTSYILKPIDMELLLDAIQKASLEVENKRLKQHLKEEINKKTQELLDRNKLLDYQLHTDNLTKLFNRNSLLKNINKAENPIVILIDIDSFKNINDMYGEKIGDIILYKIAQILKHFVEDKDCSLYKVGSDEFVLMKDILFNEYDCLDNINDIIDTVSSKPIYIDELNLSISINITMGIAVSKKDTLGHADMALKKAKQTKLAYKIYDDEIEQEYKNDIKWTKIIDEAIKDDRVIPYFQPIVDENEKILKYESLMRIEDTDKVFSPFFFLDIAKKSKQYTKLERMMILKVISKLEINQTQVNINVSIEDMISGHFIHFIKDLLERYDVAKLITFEVLESESIDDYTKVIEFIDMVKSYGSKIAIDDFGSGYSNFSHLLKLSPDYIKIDGSLIKDIDTDKNSLIITQTINDFAHKLGIKTVAEYVHSKKIFEILKGIGIDQYQGYYFGEPKK